MPTGTAPRKPVEHKPEPRKIEHYFVVTAQGTSAHRHGPFLSRDVAIEWVGKHFPHAQCWLQPAEYVGKVQARALDADGQLVNER
jgi:hypothetical protein